MVRCFSVPPRVYFKYGCTRICINELVEEFHRTRFLIVTDPSVVNANIATSICQMIHDAGSASFVFSNMHKGCTEAAMESLRRVFMSFTPDCIVALGGGSSMSLAKLMWREAEKPTTVRDPKILNVAIPTTAGSGAEVTPFAVMKHEDGTEETIVDSFMVPHMSIVDPDHSMKLERDVTATGAVHTLANAMEAFFSSQVSDFVVPFATGAIKLVEDYLPVVLETPVHTRGREHLANAAMMAGIAHSNIVNTGVLHALISAVSARFDVTYGEAAAVFMKPVVELLIEKLPICREYFEEAFNGTGVEHMEKGIVASGLARNAASFGADEAAYKTKVAEIVAKWDHVDVTSEEIEKILLAAF